MVRVVYSKEFEEDVKKIRDKALKERLVKQVEKILTNPEVGKPLRYNLKGERSVYVSPYRLVYALIDDKIFLLRFRHREDVYD
ncbi:MAG: Plasmid stabilization system protein [Candidatus Methanofastidiosum methylothiophilum]|uniref:Plasmid stabilization system protein n=1 Tax=Candidatus Methanofastidiosum methylothiophilum TaxID=1705564 RepID=A0A150J6K1_9EURY|nr:MAG: Plasmid stabilization system protein [Candidatus Methanofastidiosum methylthiophilus]